MKHITFKSSVFWFFTLLLTLLMMATTIIPSIARITTERELTKITAEYDGKTEDITLDTGTLLDLSKLTVTAVFTITKTDSSTDTEEVTEELKVVNKNQYTISSQTVLEGTKDYTITYEYRGDKEKTKITITGIGESDEEFLYQPRGGWYLLNANGSMVKNTWRKVDGSWYLFDADGYLLRGWQQKNGFWYYLDKDSYSMVTGWFIDPDDGSRFYLNTDGSMKASDWLYENNHWYYFNSTGLLATGWITDNNKTYFINSDHTMATGWLLLQYTWYYFSEDGSMLTGWQFINGYWYYFSANGMMAANTFIDGYYLNTDGVWIPGY